MFRIYCVPDPVCSILCTVYDLILQQSYEADGYHLQFTENIGGTERVSKFPKVTQLILGVRTRIRVSWKDQVLRLSTT